MQTLSDYKTLIAKIAWTLAPLCWGVFVWFMIWEWGAYFGSFNYLVRIIMGCSITYFFFSKALNNAARSYRIQCFGYSVPVPPWWIFSLVAIIAPIALFIPILHRSPFIESLICGVIVSAIIEEYITRAFFVRYSMKFPEFIAYNMVSSLTFTAMHMFYTQEIKSFIEVLLNGHLAFGFALGIIVYKTRRIELAILLHMVSNLLRYTIPVCLFNSPYPSTIAILCVVCADLLFFISLGGCSSQELT